MDLRHKKIVNLQEQQKQLKNKLLGYDANGLTFRQRKIKKMKEDSYNKKMKSVKIRKVKRRVIQTKSKKMKKNTKTIKFDSFY